MSKRQSGTAAADLPSFPRCTGPVPASFQSLMIVKREIAGARDSLREARVELLEENISSGAYSIEPVRVAQALLDEILGAASDNLES
ncbi:MAG: hypothetical protein C4318_08410 [Acidimicrobiia bacterium]